MITPLTDGAMIPLYANITIQNNIKEVEKNQEWLNTLTKSKRSQAQQQGRVIAPELRSLKGVVIPSTDIKAINDNCLKRIAKQFDIKEKFIVVTVDKYRAIEGGKLYINDWTKLEV